jgi:sulfhydrogenase subunit alpha
MTNNVHVDVHHLTRVEGHGNIKVDIKNGEIKECQLEIVEAPRFFEAMLKGRHFTEAALITSRICGICSVGHQLTSLAATEDAFGIKLSLQEKLLRRLINCGEFFESHVLHIYFLAVPDFVGAKSVLPLVKTHKEVVLQALKLKRLGHYIGDVIGGRLIHPINLYPQAFSKITD